MSPSMELAGEQMMARIMASGGIIAAGDERRRGSGSLGRITPLGRINEDDEERSPASVEHSKGDGEEEEAHDERLGSNLTISEEKMVVIKEGKVIEIESGQVLLEGQKVLDLEEGKMVELADGKIVGLDGGKLLEFEGENYMGDNYGAENGKFPVPERYVMGGGEQYPYSGDDKHGMSGAKHYERKLEDESYDNLRKDQYMGGYNQSMMHHSTEYDQLPYVVTPSYQRPPPNFAGAYSGADLHRQQQQQQQQQQQAMLCSPNMAGHYAPLMSNCDYNPPPHGGHTTPAQYKSTSVGPAYNVTSGGAAYNVTSVGGGPAYNVTSGGSAYNAPLPPPAQQYLHISAQQQQRQ